ncbi:MAG TPA: hypothetical protein ENH91_09535 [Leeuwenhoekiella sp.]|nr:hypothetical protein [Leeuwenhoekiella sp.]
MATVDKLRSGIIDKIQSINDEGFLETLDKVIPSSDSESLFSLTDEQKAMLEMSEDDIKNGRLISLEAMNKRNLEWLNEM